jgi:hypothetical protein
MPRIVSRHHQKFGFRLFISSLTRRLAKSSLTPRVRAPHPPLTLFSPQNSPHESLVSTYFYAILRTDVLVLSSQQLPRSLPIAYRPAFLHMPQDNLELVLSTDNRQPPTDSRLYLRDDSPHFGEGKPFVCNRFSRAFFIKRIPQPTPPPLPFPDLQPPAYNQ